MKANPNVNAQDLAPYIRRLFTLLILCFASPLTAQTYGLFDYDDYGSYIAIVDYPESANGPAVIPSSINGKPVTRIEQGAFWNCAGLTGVTIPTSITSIGDSAFGYCGLSQVSIPASVTSIGSDAFVGCSVLNSITVNKSNATYSSTGGILFNKSKTNLIKCPEAKTGSVAIPASVTSIGILAFDSCNDLTAVTIPASVTSIGSYAFASCTRLTDVTIPASVTSIGARAFDGCVGLAAITVDPSNPAYSGVDGLVLNKSQTMLIQCPAGKTGDVVIPASVTSIGVGAFSGCSGLTSVTIPSGVTSIGVGAFSGCSSLTGVTIPFGVTSIGSSAFSYCGSLAGITIPESVTSIGYSAFNKCRGLTSVTIPYGVASISNSAFSGCYALTEVMIPASVTSIGSSAFFDCRNLTDLSIPASVTSIGSDAFFGCRNLTVVAIPASVTSIESDAFSYCTSLIAITVDPSNANYSSVDGILTNKDQTTLIRCPEGKAGDITIPGSVTSIGNSAFSGCGALTNVMIPANVVSIGSSAFSDCKGLTSVTIPSSVTSIGGSAFNGCAGLTSVTMPANITNIGSYAFYGCSGLTSLAIPASITSIEYGAFSGCSGLTSLSIPASVTSISNSAFSRCVSLTAITVDPANSTYSSADGILFNKSQTGLIRCPGGKTGVITIPTSVTSISSSAFSSCSGLTGVTVPASVASIGSSAFFGCSSLTEIAVDPSNAAYSSLNGVLFNKSQTTLVQYPVGKSGNFTIPGSVTNIGGSAFSGCNGLTSVTIPAGVTTIGDYAFYGCNSLMEIMVDPSNPNYSSVDGILFNKSQTVLIQYPGGRSGNVTIPASVMNLASGAFNDSESLTSLCFLGDSPSQIWYSFPQTVTVHYCNGAIGFTPPSWTSHTVVNMGSVSPLKPWLIDHGFPFDANLLSDPNSDGVNLLMAYAFGLDPTQNLSDSMPQPEVADGWMSLTFYAKSDGISYKAETSANMQNWTTEGVSLSLPDANGYRTAGVPVNAPSRFLRVVVSH